MYIQTIEYSNCFYKIPRCKTDDENHVIVWFVKLAKA